MSPSLADMAANPWIVGMIAAVAASVISATGRVLWLVLRSHDLRIVHAITTIRFASLPPQTAMLSTSMLSPPRSISRRECRADRVIQLEIENVGAHTSYGVRVLAHESVAMSLCNRVHELGIGKRLPSIARHHRETLMVDVPGFHTDDMTDPQDVNVYGWVVPRRGRIAAFGVRARLHPPAARETEPIPTRLTRTASLAARYLARVHGPFSSRHDRLKLSNLMRNFFGVPADLMCALAAAERRRYDR